jgi:hypothetical protein
MGFGLDVSIYWTTSQVVTTINYNTFRLFSNLLHLLERCLPLCYVFTLLSLVVVSALSSAGLYLLGGWSSKHLLEQPCFHIQSAYVRVVT